MREQERVHSREQTLRAAAGIQKSDPNGTNYGLGGGRQPTNGKEISSAAQRGPADVHRRNVKRQESIRFKCILNLSLTWLLEFIVERERERDSWVTAANGATNCQLMACLPSSSSIYHDDTVAVRNGTIASTAAFARRSQAWRLQ